MSDFNTEHNRVVWCDIPVTDLDRAIAFYEAVLGVAVTRESFGDTSFGVLSHQDGNGACLVPNHEEIAAGGVLIYLNVDGRIRDAVRQVVPHGGSLLRDTHPIGPHGYRALVLDSEGNRIALHATTDQPDVN